MLERRGGVAASKVRSPLRTPSTLHASRGSQGAAKAAEAARAAAAAAEAEAALAREIGASAFPGGPAQLWPPEDSSSSLRERAEAPNAQLDFRADLEARDVERRDWEDWESTRRHAEHAAYEQLEKEWREAERRAFMQHMEAARAEAERREAERRAAIEHDLAAHYSRLSVAQQHLMQQALPPSQNLKAEFGSSTKVALGASHALIQFEGMKHSLSNLEAAAHLLQPGQVFYLIQHDGKAKPRRQSAKTRPVGAHRDAPQLLRPARSASSTLIRNEATDTHKSHPPQPAALLPGPGSFSMARTNSAPPVTWRPAPKAKSTKNYERARRVYGLDAGEVYGLEPKRDRFGTPGLRPKDEKVNGRPAWHP